MNGFEFSALYRQARDADDAQIVIDALPYATFLGMQALKTGSGLMFKLPPKKSNIGNPILPAIHGGAVAGFMEMSAIVQLLMAFDETHQPQEGIKTPRIVDFSIDYVRACRFEDTYAACDVVRQGRKMANVGIRVWQGDPNTLTATARAHYLLS